MKGIEDSIGVLKILNKDWEISPAMDYTAPEEVFSWEYAEA